jgi:methylthioribose-1-phosphate isomerase
MPHKLGADNVHAIEYQPGTLILLDQRKLPLEETYLHFQNAHSTASAITDMVVRGAPAIGICAAFGIALEARLQINLPALNLNDAFKVLAASRPTAVNLFWALKKMRTAITQCASLSMTEQVGFLEGVAHTILKDDIANNHKMGELGASLIDADSQVYTHCNAGALATGGYGTALGVIRSAHAHKKIIHVYAGETRPWLQGARLTAWELMKDNIPVTLSCEGAAGQLLRQGNIKWIIVGADRISSNGDVANKIGTYNLAVLAKYHNVKFMVVAPSSTFDLSIEKGDDIPIEARDKNEVTHIQGIQMAPQECSAINPSFDVTPNELITAIICEQGIILEPNKEKIMAMLGHLKKERS